MPMHVCACVRLRACVRAYVHACVRAGGRNMRANAYVRTGVRA